MQAASQDGGGEYHPEDAFEAGLIAKTKIEQDMGWWNHPWKWR